MSSHSEISAHKYDLLSPDFFAAPEPTLRAMRENDPIFWHDAVKCWILTRYDDNQFVLRDKRFSVDRSGLVGTGSSPAVQKEVAWCNEFLKSWLVFSDPPRHARLRSLVSRAFVPQRIASLKAPIERMASELIAKVADKGAMEVVSDFALPLPSLITGEMLGLPLSRADDLKRWSDDLFRLVGAGVATDELILACYKGLAECQAYFSEVITERRASPGDDLISQLILAANEVPDVTHHELIAVCATLMAGSYETTTHLITNGLYALLTHPEQLALLKSQPDLMESAVEELFRFTGPGLSVVRRPTSDVELDGYVFKAGTNVCCMLHGANHDPKYFAEPERLDITRKDNRHVGLGVGIHFCLGAALTRMETRIALETLIRLPGLTLTDKVPVFRPNLVMRGIGALQVRFTPQRTAATNTSAAARELAISP